MAEDYKWLADEGWLSVFEISELFGVSMARANQMIVEDREFDCEDVRRSRGGKGMWFVRDSAAQELKKRWDHFVDKWMAMSPEEQSEFRKAVRAWLLDRLGEKLPAGDLPRRLMLAYMEDQERKTARRRPAKKAAAAPAKKATPAKAVDTAKTAAKKLIPSRRRTPQN